MANGDTTVKAAIVQTAWTGDKESMIELHEKYVAEAAAEGTQVMCFQELFYGPYFCQVQEAEYYSYAEAIPDGPTTKRFQELAAKHEHGTCPADVREGAGGNPLQHRRRDRRGWFLPGQVSQDPHPAGQRDSGRSSTSSRATSGTRCGTRRSVGLRSTSATTVTSPRAGVCSASTALRSCSTRRPRAGASPPTCGSWSRRPPRWPTCTSSGAINRVGIEPLGRQRLLRHELLLRPPGPVRGRSGLGLRMPSWSSATSTSNLIEEVRNQWAFYRDRRPEMYDRITEL